MQKILAYKFWILLAVACVCPLVGWWMGHSAMAAAYAARSKDLDSAIGALKADPNPPNMKWQETANGFNKEQEASVQKAWKALYDKQQPAKVWPANMVAYDKAKPYELAEYPPKYVEQRRAVWEIVRPITVSGEGVVEFADETLVNVGWPDKAPSAVMVYNAQEDLWLTRAVLEALARVNEGIESQHDAPLRKIEELYLVKGGDGYLKSPPPPSGSGTTATAAPGGMTSVGSGNTAVATGPTAADFNPRDEFGAPAAAEQAATGGTGTGAGASAGAAGVGMGMQQGNGDGQGKLKEEVEVPTVSRYVDKTTYYNTRGFYMKLVMDHNAVPKLLVELSNSEKWPIRVTRVQQIDVKPSEFHDAGVAGPGNVRGAVGRPGFGNAPIPPPGSGRRLAGAEGVDPMGAGVDAAKGQNLDDPKLAYVCLSGLITIYNPPPADPNAPAPGSETPAAGATPPVAAGPAAPGPMTTGPMGAAATTTAPGSATAESSPKGTATPATTGAATTTPATDATAADAKPAGTTPGDAKPVDAKTTDDKPADAKPADVKPVDPPKPVPATTTPAATTTPTSPPAGNVTPAKP